MHDVGTRQPKNPHVADLSSSLRLSELDMHLGELASAVTFDMTSWLAVAFWTRVRGGRLVLVGFHRRPMPHERPRRRRAAHR